ncbi:MAG TPA: hypothetical protein VL125_17205 [Pelobium sp.]|nr:hypothetical protein [Pelobium sp.]
MKIKDVIQAFIKQNKEVQNIISESSFEGDFADNVVLNFKDNLLKSKFNSALGLKFTLLLQLTNEKEITDQYELEDIRLLFNSLLEIQQYNIDLYLESGHFEWSVMDNKENAIKIIDKGLEIALKKVEELKKLRSEINES